ncbi:MAG: ATP-binding cassette domain-containing protein [Spirochaetaceae bacterium]|nr:MAG: ATP-binding cassette domain-containing protein [Spirochaetaceae bacterium]
MATDHTPIVEVRGLCRTYELGAETVHALRDVDLTVDRGEFVAVMGPSGSGKSTFLNQLGCLDRPDAGTYHLDGTEVSQLSDDELSAVRGRTIGFVFQRFNLLARTSAIDNIELPLLYQGYRGGGERGQSLLDLVGLPERGRHRPQELSGGEQQRVAIARALVNSPRLILADEPTGNLDSSRGEEIMQMLCRLNDAGITVILVTHEEDIARYAKRIVRFADGYIVSDEPVADRAAAASSSSSSPESSATDSMPDAVPDPLQTKQRAASLSRMLRYSGSALVSIAQNKLRATLTVLGILIGVAAVIALVAIGQGAQNSIRAQVQSLGSNLITVVPQSARTAGGAAIEAPLTVDDARAIFASIPGVVGVAPEISQRASVRYGRTGSNLTIIGTSEAYPIIRNWPVAEGSFFTAADLDADRAVAVLGWNVAEDLFPYRGAIGQTIRVGTFSYEVVGILSERGGGGFLSNDNAVFIPVTTAARRLSGSNEVRSIAVAAAEEDQVEAVRAQIAALMRERHRVPSGAGDTVTIQTQADVLGALEGISGTLTMLLAGIAGISLLVGGIGIMNIMLVSVTERTREIGIRKAIGARSADVMMQFLTESVLLSGLGGLLGWLSGAGIARAFTALAGIPASLTLSTVGAAIGFSMAVGVFFGWYPARKAAHLDPIEALRFE